MADEKCGCQYHDVTPEGWVIEVYDGIEYCSLHAAAPQMAEMLKRLEWVWVVKEGGRCPVCFGWQDIEFQRGHEQDCELQTLLKEIANG